MIASLKNNFPDVIFNGDCETDGLVNLISIALPPRSRSELLIQRLDMDGVAISGGSACASGAHSISHVMQALGRDAGMPVIRISFSRYNTLDEADHFIEILKKAYK